MTVTHYQNPIRRGMYPDPSLVLVDDTYYMVNSTFEYYPGIALSKSNDLLNWTSLPSVATRYEQADLRQAKSNEGIFAVCIRYHHGYFYVITTNFAEFKNFIIRGRLNEDKTAIIWEEKRTEVDIFGIDPDIYFEDERVYVHFTGFVQDGQKALQQVEINLESGSILRGPEILSYGTGGRDVEGPHIIKKNGYYYLLAAEGGTGQGHMITIFRGKSLWGPFESAPSNPILTNRDRADEPLQNIGHADLFQDTSGNWWMTCLGTRPATVGHIQITNLGRETLLYPVDWSGDWPIVNHGLASVEVDLTDFPKHAEALTTEQNLTDFVDRFESDALHPDWLTLRDKLGDKLAIGKNRLKLHGTVTTLSEQGTPGFIGLRQAEHQEEFQVILDSENTQINQGAVGIASLINNEHYASLLIEQNESGGYQVHKVIKVLDLEVDEIIGHLDQLPTTLTLQNSKDTKTFIAKSKVETIQFQTKAQHFSNEAIAALNTGDMEGIYVLGDAKLVATKASRRALTTEE